MANKYKLKISIMKRVGMSLLLIAGFIASVSAQEKKWEHSVNFSAGLFLDGITLDYNSGLSAKLGYGISYQFAERFSMKLGVAYRVDMESPVKMFGYDGGDYDSFAFVEVPLIARYHTEGGFVFGMGPVFSFCIENDTYYVNSDPHHPLNGMTKIKEFCVGVQPSVMYKWEHFSLGVEATFGLMDVNLNHGLAAGGKYLHQITGSVAYCF